MIKHYFLRALSIGVHSDLSEGKKLAVQIATLDGYWTVVVTFFYVLYAFYRGVFPLFEVHLAGFVLTLLGIWLLWKRRYDAGRALLHFTGLGLIFLTTDAIGANSGAEFFYFTSIAIPFVTFNFEEQWKGNLLTAIACVVFLLQLQIGHHLFMAPTVATEGDRFSAIAFVISYFLIVFGIGRRQLKIAHEEIKRQQNEVFHSSQLIALGEMAAGIAHEINNPLQVLSLQLLVLKDKAQKDFDEVSKMDATINKMAKMVQSLKHLSRNPGNDHKENYLFSKVLEDVLMVSSDRMRDNGISLTVEGECSHNLSGHPIHISQVLMNLLNNSIDAIKNLEEKWVEISVAKKNDFIEVSVTDSGRGIHPEIATKMMNAFYTTKKPSEGTGLGLSISKTIIERNRGTLFYDPSSFYTKFVILLPVSISK